MRYINLTMIFIFKSNGASKMSLYILNWINLILELTLIIAMIKFIYTIRVSTRQEKFMLSIIMCFNIASVLLGFVEVLNPIISTVIILYGFYIVYRMHKVLIIREKSK